MARVVQCAKLGKEAEGLDFPPFPGAMGQKIFDSISKEAWQGWMGQQTILINEYRLNAIDPKARKFLQEEMDKYLFGEGSTLPEAHTPPE